MAAGARRCHDRGVIDVDIAAVLDPTPRSARSSGRAAFVAAAHHTATNRALAAAFRRVGLESRLVAPRDLLGHVHAGDIVLGRLDVVGTLDGIEPGLSTLDHAEALGAVVLNGAKALRAPHDTLETALRLSVGGIPPPRTALVDDALDVPAIRPPVVVKPRFGSWGRDVVLCPTRHALHECLTRLSTRRWFRRQGALIQELVQPCGFDLRLVVSGTSVVGAIERRAAPGEWRTNVALGATRLRVSTVPDSARALAVAAASAVGASLVGVDLLPLGDGRWTVLELNGAVDFTTEYSVDGADVFVDAARELAGRRLYAVV